MSPRIGFGSDLDEVREDKKARERAETVARYDPGDDFNDRWTPVDEIWVVRGATWIGRSLAFIVGLVAYYLF